MKGGDHMGASKDPYLQTLGQNIKYLRIQHGWSQEELAEKCGYTSDTRKSTISKIENGQSDLPISKLKIFAKVLGVTCSDLCDSIQDREQKIICDLMEKCYGQDAYRMVQTFLKLDQDDRLIIYGEMLGMMKADKYAVKKESSEQKAM